MRCPVLLKFSQQATTRGSSEEMGFGDLVIDSNINASSWESFSLLMTSEISRSVGRSIEDLLSHKQFLQKSLPKELPSSKHTYVRSSQTGQRGRQGSRLLNFTTFEIAVTPLIGGEKAR